jgi:hypothetical protein
MAATLWSWDFGRNRPAPIVEGPQEPPIPDQFWQRLLKAVPVQAVGFITAADALAHAAPADILTAVLGGVFIFGAFIGLLEMAVQRKAGRIEIIVALVAYVVWCYALGGVFEALGWFQPVVAGLIALGFAALLPFLPTKPTQAPG